MTTIAVPTSTLSEIERHAKARAEQAIERGLQSFVEVGEALAKVRDLRLYRDEYGTFEEYCDAKWNLTDARVNQMITASQVTTMVVTTGAPAPSNERQARELSGLPPERAADVMRKAHADTGGKVTAKAIKDARDMQAVAEATATPEPSSEPEAPVKADGRRQGRYGRRVKHRDVIDRITTSLGGLVMAVQDITELDQSVTAEEAARLTRDLSKQIKAMTKLNRLLEERTK